VDALQSKFGALGRLGVGSRQLGVIGGLVFDFEVSCGRVGVVELELGNWWSWVVGVVGVVGVVEGSL